MSAPGRALLAAALVALLGLGLAMCLGGSFSYAAVTLIAKAARGLSSYALAFWQCMAYVLLYAGMARLSAGRIAVLQFVYPAAAICVDWAVYGRRLSVAQWAGVLLMGAALLALSRPVRRP